MTGYRPEFYFSPDFEHNISDTPAAFDQLMRLSDALEWQAGRNIVDQLITFQQRCQIGDGTLSERGIQVVDYEEVQMDALPNCRGKRHADLRGSAAIDDHLPILSQNGNIRVEIGGEVYLHNTVY